MIKTKTILEVKIGERNYELSCAPDSPMGELFDALMQMKGFCVERMSVTHKEELDYAESMRSEEENQK